MLGKVVSDEDNVSRRLPDILLEIDLSDSLAMFKAIGTDKEKETIIALATFKENVYAIG